MEIFIFTRFHSLAVTQAAVAESLHEVVAPTSQEAGCLGIHAFRSIRDPQLFYIHSRWKDEAAFETHAKLPHTLRFIARVETLIDHPIEAHRCEVLA
jgi:quinol monooxygenase YgiN